VTILGKDLIGLAGMSREQITAILDVAEPHDADPHGSGAEACDVKVQPRIAVAACVLLEQTWEIIHIRVHVLDPRWLLKRAVVLRGPGEKREGLAP
jgi:hypothetical protein